MAKQYNINQLKRGYMNTSIFRRLFVASQKVSTTLLLTLLMTVLAVPVITYADSYQAQINQLKQQNANSAQQKQNLQGTATTISERISGIQAEISAVEAQLQANQAKQAKLEQDITAAKAELVKQKAVLGASLKQSYVENGMSTLEMLASSNDLSEYVDKAQYRNAVQGQITETLNKINTLKAQLETQKTEVDRLVKDQQTMQGQLSAQRAENSRLLSLNQGQQSQLEQTMRDNSTKITALQRQQAIENARGNIGAVQVGGTGGYPWYNVAYPSSSPDPWGMYKRECVSYAAWKVDNSGRYMPYWGGRGNAKLWDNNAQSAGIPVDATPRVGDVAISLSLIHI